MVTKKGASSAWTTSVIESEIPDERPTSATLSPTLQSTRFLPAGGLRIGRCDIMISYHPSDAKLLDRIIPSLEERGFSVWHADPSSSDAMNAQLKGKAVLDTQVFVFIVSQAALNHAPCKDEAALAYISGKPIIPLGVQSYQDLEPYLDSAMKMLLAKLNWTFFVNEEDWDKHLPEMADSVSEAIAPATTEDDLFTSVPERRLTEEMEFDVEYNSMTESRQRVYISLRRNLSVQQDDMIAGTFEGIGFWETHFSGEQSVPTENFVVAFITDYGDRIRRHVDDAVFELLQQKQRQTQQPLHASPEDWFRLLLTKDLLSGAETVNREVYDALCAAASHRAMPRPDMGGDAFYNRVKEYAIGKLAMLKVFNMDSSVRLVAIQNLGSYQTPEIVSGLVELLEDVDPNIRTVATLALGRCKQNTDTIVPRLIKMMRDCDRLVRQAACISLGHLRASSAVKTLVTVWRNEPIRDVREAALAALERMDSDDARIAIDMTKKLDQEMKRLAKRP